MFDCSAASTPLVPEELASDVDAFPEASRKRTSVVSVMETGMAFARGWPDSPSICRWLVFAGVFACAQEGVWGGQRQLIMRSSYVDDNGVRPHASGHCLVGHQRAPDPRSWRGHVHHAS